MKPAISKQNAPAQCAVCHTSDFARLDKVCHRCGRALCKDHPGTDPPDFKQIKDIEFTGLDLRGADISQAVYCEACAKQISSLTQLWRLIAASLHKLGLKLLLFGKLRPPVPIIPTVRKLAVAEALSGRYTLKPDGQVDSSTFAEANGKLTVDLQFAEHDRARLAAYLRKYLVRDKLNLMMHAGFVLFKHTADLKWERPKDEDYPQAGMFALRSPQKDLPFFASVPQSNDNQGKREFTYTVKRSDGKPIPLPVQIVPSLVDDHGQLALELDIQLRPDAGRFIQFETARIKEFQLEPPETLGAFQNSSPRPTKRANLPDHQTETANSTPSLIWSGLKSLTIAAPVETIHLNLPAALDSASTLKGKLVVSFNGTLSESQEARCFYSWGPAASTPELQRATEVTITFDLSLHSLSAQSVAQRTDKISEDGALLTADLIADLTKFLSEQEKLYIRRIVEQPPQPSRADAEEMHLAWDIAARRYDAGIQLFDVHLNLTGTTVADRPQQNNVTVHCSVQGSGPDTGAVQAQVDTLLQTLVRQLPVVFRIHSLRVRKEEERKRQARWNGDTFNYN